MAPNPWIIGKSNFGSSVTQLTSSIAGYPTLEIDNPNPKSGQAILGLSTAKTGDNTGVYGQTDSTGGTGILGIAISASGLSFGVRGEAFSTAGIAVRGVASGKTGENFGVHGAALSMKGAGVLAEHMKKGDALRCEGHAMPSTDNKFNLGDSKRRWRHLHAKTITSGDLVFENGVKATEDGNGLAFTNAKGTKIARLDSKGNLHIKGRVIKDL